MVTVSSSSTDQEFKLKVQIGDQEYYSTWKAEGPVTPQILSLILHAMADCIRTLGIDFPMTDEYLIERWSLDNKYREKHQEENK